MKGNIKKLAVVVMVAAIAMFTVVAMASADDRDRDDQQKGIRGEYALSGLGTCLFSVAGFNSNYVPLTGYPSWAGSSMGTGIWTFKRDGTGTVQGTSFALTFPFPLPSIPSASAATKAFSFNFNYQVNDDDTITVDMVGPYTETTLTGSLTGWVYTTDTNHFFGYVSADRKTITLASGNVVQTFTRGTTPPTYTGTLPAAAVYAICNTERVLIQLDEMESKEKRH